MKDSNSSQPVLLYDGLCGVCNRGVQYILRYDTQKTVLFASLQSEYGKSTVSRHPYLAGIDSVVWVVLGVDADKERVFVKSDALLQIARYLGWPWKLALAAYMIPKAARDYLYDQFARRVTHQNL